MNYYGITLVLMLLLLTMGCTDKDLNTSVTPVSGMAAAPVTTQALAASVPGQDPLIGVWRITNSQGYDNRYRFNADGTFEESYFDTKSGVSQLHAGTWTLQNTDSYTIHDKVTGESATWAYDPAKKTIHSVAIPHLLLTPYAGDVAPGVTFTIAIPTKTAVPTATTAAPTTVVPTAAPAIPEPVTIAGVGSKMVSFEAKHPGDVKIKIYYNLSAGEDLKCIDDVTRFRLAGPTIDTTLYYGRVDKLHDEVHILRLPVPGRYTITVTGCWGWNILIDNA